MAKLGTTVLRRLHQSHSTSAARGRPRLNVLAACPHRCFYAVSEQSSAEKKRGRWFTLPPFAPTTDGNLLGRKLSDGGDAENSSASEKMTALKWVLRCCPDVPRSLVQKLFRLRQVRREVAVEPSGNDSQDPKSRLKRVAAKESLSIGDRIHLPISVGETPAVKNRGSPCNQEELKFIRSFVLYKDPAIIVINKPPGMPVQGGVGIKRSLDELAAYCLRFDSSEPPRLVHRLDRDCSGLLVLARTQTSAMVLHSIFREKTSSAAKDVSHKERRILRRKYWALVIGSPKSSKGLISAPLRKVVVDDGKSERLTVNDHGQVLSSQHAVTEYEVIESSPRGFTWLELIPLTGRKHQLRVHCAEVLRTPIVGDYKYGWQAHRQQSQLLHSDSAETLDDKSSKVFPFGLDLEGGSITSKQPYLHLHCKEMVLPSISQVLETVEVSPNCNLSEAKNLKLAAPLPTHMQVSWETLNS